MWSVRLKVIKEDFEQSLSASQVLTDATYEFFKYSYSQDSDISVKHTHIYICNIKILYFALSRFRETRHSNALRL